MPNSYLLTFYKDCWEREIGVILYSDEFELGVIDLIKKLMHTPVY